MDSTLSADQAELKHSPGSLAVPAQDIADARPGRR